MFLALAAYFLIDFFVVKLTPFFLNNQPTENSLCLIVLGIALQDFSTHTLSLSEISDFDVNFN